MRDKPVGVTLGWDGKIHLSFSDGKYLPSKVEKILYPDYFISGQDWPVDPLTKEKLPIADMKEVNE